MEDKLTCESCAHFDCDTSKCLLFSSYGTREHRVISNPETNGCKWHSESNKDSEWEYE